MLTIYSPEHHEHAPEFEIFRGERVPCFEKPVRANIVQARLAERGHVFQPALVDSRPVLQKIHTARYLKFLENAWSDWLALDPDNAGRQTFPSVWPVRTLRSDIEPVNFTARLGLYSMDNGCPLVGGTWAAAKAGADAAASAAALVMAGEQGVFCCTRPPGHHAGADFMGGYCFINNAAVAAQAMLDAGIKKVALLDVDYHHGNGTQSIFYERSDVLFVSIHGDPLTEYPFYLGHADETGTGEGEGFNLNLPLPAGSAVADWFAALETACDRITVYGAETLVVSLGLDTFAGDPISKFKLLPDDFVILGQRLGRLGLRTVFILEGGYAATELGVNAVNVLEGFENSAAGGVTGMEQVDVVVVGAGVVGLAVARALALQGREVLVLEAANAIGTGTSSRNSEVIHAGIYYPQGSLKARLCVRGKNLLYDYCAERGIGHRRCGKLIVATSHAQVANLQAIIDKAAANGVTDLVLLSREEARALEPQLECVAAVLSPSTGIVDSHAFMLALQGDLENASGFVVLNSPVVHALRASDAIVIEANDGTRLQAKTVVNAAGLHAQSLARQFAGLDSRFVPPSHYAKGSYFTLSGRSPFQRLIYPVPEAAGLGVHLTLDLGGQARFGPDVQWVDSPDDLLVDAKRGDAFYAEVRKYWPQLSDGALQPAYAGIRPKVHAPHEAAHDFMIQGPETHGVKGLVNLFGIESPGLTSALALGEHVGQMIQNQ